MTPLSAACVARCARRGWRLRETTEGWELTGLGAPAVFGRIEAVAVWLDRQTQDHEEIIDAAQMTFLETA